MSVDHQFPQLSAGFVIRRQPGVDPKPIAAGPRIVLCADGSLLCSYMLTAGLGRNDFFPCLSRSLDFGETWQECGGIWPDLEQQWSIFTSISRAADGTLFQFGTRYPIDVPGEMFWSDATQGLKQNELFWAKSHDSGHTWTSPQVIPMPIPGSAEAPGALIVARNGRWLAPYSPYNTFDPAVVVDRHQVVLVYSDNQGRSWHHTSMIRFDDPATNAAEAWVTEISGGVLLGTTWHIGPTGSADLPNKFAISRDVGTTWAPTQSTGILGQSTSLTTLPDGRGVFLYNQRRHGTPGVWMAVVRPTETDFGISQQGIAWSAATTTQAATSGEHAEWTDFSFGEPAAAVLPDGTILVVLWCVQPDGQGVRYVRIRLH